MNAGWEWSTIGRECVIRPPKSESKRLQSGEFVSFVPMECLNAGKKGLDLGQLRTVDSVYSGYTYFAEGDVLLAKITPCFQNGKLGIARGLHNGVGFGSSEFMVLRPRGRIIPDFLYYFLSQRRFVDQGTSQMTGAVGHQRVPLEYVESFPLPVPPISEQERIVRVLDDAFACINQARGNTATNLANAQGLQRSILAKPLLNAAQKFPTIPLGQVCEFQGGAQPPKSSFVDKPQPGYVRLLQIRDFGSDEKAVYIPESLAKRRCTTADVMIGRYGASVGQIHRGKAGAYNVALIKTIPDVGLLDPEYFYFYLLSPLFQEPLARVAQRSAQAGFSKSDINVFPVPVPPLDAQKLIASSISASQSASRALLNRYQGRSQLLVSLRFALLEAAFSGELSAGGCEVRLPARAARM